jgi:hypothetical protein
MDDVPYDALSEIYDWLVPDALLTPRLSAEAFSPITAELAPGSRVLDCAEDLDAAGLVPESSTFAPGVERYLVTARRPA